MVTVLLLISIEDWNTFIDLSNRIESISISMREFRSKGSAPRVKCKSRFGEGESDRVSITYSPRPVVGL